MTKIKTLKQVNSLTEITESLEFELLDQAEIDGINVLARVSGPAFFPGKVSENNVRYTAEFWKTILDDPEVQKRLDDKTMFGTIGHEIIHITDEQLLKGIASHITTKLWVDQVSGIGMAEHLVLNTEAGRTLNTMLRAGSKLKVSTRGLGNLSTGDDGVNEIDEYYFQRIDFVINPGFEGALPSVVESLMTGDQNKFNYKDSPMDPQVTEILQSQISDLKSQVEDAVQEVKDKNEELDNVKDQLSDVKTELALTTNELDNYENIGSAEEITEALSSAEQLINDYSNLGTPDEIEEAIDSANDAIKNLQYRIENTDDYQEKAELQAELDEYLELGTPDEISEALTRANKLLSKYKPLGNPKHISEAFRHFDNILSKSKRMVAESLSKRYKTNVSIIESLLETNSEEEVESMLSQDIDEDDNNINDPNFEVNYGDFDEDDEDEDEEIYESRRSRSRRIGNISNKRRGKTKTLAESLGTNVSLSARLLNKRMVK